MLQEPNTIALSGLFSVCLKCTGLRTGFSKVKTTIVKTTIVTIVTIVNTPTVLTMPPSAVCVGTW